MLFNNMTKSWKRYILWFAQEHVDFRQAVNKKLSSILLAIVYLWFLYFRSSIL